MDQLTKNTIGFLIIIAGMYAISQFAALALKLITQWRNTKTIDQQRLRMSLLWFMTFCSAYIILQIFPELIQFDISPAPKIPLNLNN